MGNLPEGVSQYKDRHGKIRYRFRRKGLPTCQLPSPDDPKFAEAYAAARAGRLRTPARRLAPAPRTLRSTWLEVTRTIGWRQLKGSSKTQQIGVAERFLAATCHSACNIDPLSGGIGVQN